MIVLRLPLPPNPRSYERQHWAAQHRVAREYMRDCWTVAISQHEPWKEPPHRMALSVAFHITDQFRRDRDNRTRSLKFLIDALKQTHMGKAVKGAGRLTPDLTWRGRWHTRGYFIDDNEEHLELWPLVQEVSVPTRADVCAMAALSESIQPHRRG